MTIERKNYANCLNLPIRIVGLLLGYKIIRGENRKSSKNADSTPDKEYVDGAHLYRRKHLFCVLILSYSM